jgi:hypothetical protein
MVYLAMTISIVSGFATVGLAQNVSLSERNTMWTKVNEAIEKGLPKTAIEQLQTIIDACMKDKSYAEATKAIAKKMVLKGEIEGGKPAERIRLMQAEIATAPKEMVPAMQALMASWFWNYFEQNRWQFANRTATSAAVSNDFETWDLPRLFAEIDRNYTLALQDPDYLKATPIAAYDSLLDKGTAPESYRPTLFDFLALEAIEFYASGEQAGAKPEESFDIEASSPALGPMEDFIAWKPKTNDTSSPKFKAIQLYQQVLQFHLKDPEPSALLDAELGRIRFCHANAVGEEKQSRAIAALKALADSYAKHELSAKARFQWAELLMADEDFVSAREIALQGKNAFPKSNGGIQCVNLIATIESKSVAIQTERVWTDPTPAIRIRYKNIKQVHFRAIATEWTKRLDGGRWMPGQMSPEDHVKLTRMKPDLAWTVDLPETTDYAETSQDVEAPKNLKNGYYMILASARADFLDNDNVLAASEVWVTNLALVVRQSWGTDKLDGFVLKATSGEPIVSAKVRSFSRNNNGNFIEGSAVATNVDGLFTFTGETRNMLLLASHAGNEVSSMNEYSIYANQVRPGVETQYVLFTDRAIYRPGQTIYFKGIALQADAVANKYVVAKYRLVSPVFQDINGKEIAKLDLKTNDYGSFHGSFVAPKDRGTGMMSISIADGQRASRPIRVEEYKRPKFQVTIDPLQEASKLGIETNVAGKATAYTGAAVNGAKVRYRVTRETRWPNWFISCFFWRMPPMQSAQEIAHGFATTEPDGSFRIKFVPLPDRSVSEEDQPIFRYTITADVTDGTGETRTASRSVSVGYASLAVNVSSDEWQTVDQPVKLRLETNTLDDQGQSAKGIVRIHRLKEPLKVVRADLLTSNPWQVPRGRGKAPRAGQTGRPLKTQPKPSGHDGSNPVTWELGDVVETKPFESNAEGTAETSLQLPRGHYRAIVETQDTFGKPVRAEWNIQVLDPSSKELGLKVANRLMAPKWTLEPGEKLLAIWGSGYAAARAYIEIERDNSIVNAFWTKPGTTQVRIEKEIDEALRGGFTLRTTCVVENRAYLETKVVDVPWSNKDLKLKWDRFVSKLEPAARETFTLTIQGPDAKRATAEMVATLYDESLDAFVKNQWIQRLSVFRKEGSRLYSTFNNSAVDLNIYRGNWNVTFQSVSESYRSFPYDLKQWPMRPIVMGMAFGGAQMKSRGARSMAMPGSMGSGAMADAMSLNEDKAGFALVANAPQSGEGEGEPPAGTPSGLDLSDVPIRTNLNETAFFFPQLISSDDGIVKLEFTMPEALTKWRLLGFAHDRDLRSGFIEESLVTAKDLMVQPNSPRFLREGDTLEFSAKVSNQSDRVQTGKVELHLFDARTNAPLDTVFANKAIQQSFEIAAKQTKSFVWPIQVPDGSYPIIYKVVGATGTVSDGEQGMLPVLSKRILVTESMPMPIRGKTTRDFEFKKLVESANSKTIQHQSLTVQMTSQPAWYAVLALPYLMEFPHQCSEQTFNRLYANLLAQHIANSDPKIQKVFNTWRQFQPEALDSPLAKNQDLKSVMIEETPWLRDAENESLARKNVGILFEPNRLAQETSNGMKQLAQMQRENGMWPWFPGGPDNEYLTLYIVTGFGRLKHMQIAIDDTPALRALEQLDRWMHTAYDRIQRDSKNPEDDHLNSTIALYLYGRSFFKEARPIPAEHKVAIDYWMRQATKYWLSLNSRQSQAHLALGLKRFGDMETAKGIAASLRERSVTNEELGMFWRDTERSWWWYQAPIESQAMMIEVFDEVAADADAVESCKVWLLKQKQTQAWNTTKGTADAVYGLLLRGSNLLSSDALVEVKLAGKAIKPVQVEAGTGFFTERFGRGDVQPAMGKVTLTKTDDGVSWGSLHWQYLEDIDKISPHEGTPLKLEKQIFRRSLTANGPVIEPIDGLKLVVGDELICRIVLRTDRDMEFVHLKDHRGSGTEPVNVLSGYRFQDGLAYYESTRDTASHFFIDYLRTGTYVFEYTLRIQHAGTYPSGMANIQCMYAPEFNSHSESIRLEVGKFEVGK